MEIQQRTQANGAEGRASSGKDMAYEGIWTELL
jgi:hypothetical protein